MKYIALWLPIMRNCVYMNIMPVEFNTMRMYITQFRESMALQRHNMDLQVLMKT